MKTKEEFKQQLDERYESHCSIMESSNTPEKYWPTSFLSMDVFDFTLYDCEAEQTWAASMLRVIDCILNKTTFEFQGMSDDNYNTYLAMVNMPFLCNKLEWGGSIRGAWFATYGKREFKVCCGDITFSSQEIPTFMQAVLEWSKEHGIEP